MQQPPPADRRLELLARLREQRAKLDGRARAERLAAWRRRMQESWQANKRDVHLWCADEDRAHVTMLRRPDGTYTGDFEEIDGRGAWSPIFRLYADSPEPAWEPFAERFGRYVERFEMPDLAPLTGAALRETLAKMSSRQAGGMDGWRVRELKALPEPLLDLLAGVLNLVEATGEWPAAIEQALISLIPKGEGGEPLCMRPISVMSVVYRLWAATRMRDVREWQERWIADNQHAFRPDNSTLDVFWRLSLAVEEALLQGKPLHGIALDWEKCFDRLPHRILLWLRAEMGMS
eukprot:gene18026-biopygen9074